MSKITDIKRLIQELSPAEFQEFCDTLIYKNGYTKVQGYGMKAGTGKITIGNPDTYFRKNNGKYVFVVYTTQQSSIFSKIKEDIDKCFDKNKIDLDISEIEEIICCHTSSNLSAGEDKKLHDYYEKYGTSLTIWGIDEIANQVYNRYKSMAKDFLGLSIDTTQILSIDDFITLCDSNGLSAPLNTNFQYRENEKTEIINNLNKNSVIVVTGNPGVGKTRLVLEVIQTFSNEKKYRILCVKNNNLSIYEDLVCATEKPGKYLFFVDDANDLNDFKQILKYITKQKQGYDVKIIVTVRDYAKRQVLLDISEYVKPTIIEILPFSDKEIKGFVTEVLKIKNEYFIKQIIRIAEGNPRIAYMAGILAIEKKHLSSIRDVSHIYDSYYHKYVDITLGKDRDLCFTASIISTVNAILLNDMSSVQKSLDDYGISNKIFKEKIFELARLEFLETEFDQAFILADQCLANYMLYYVFLKRKIVRLSNILKVGYKYFNNAIIRAVDIIFNLFDSEEIREYCRDEILIVWDSFKKERDPCYEKFVQDFHIFRPEEGFIMALEKIKNIDYEKFEVYDINFSKNAGSEDESILVLLSGYEHSEYLNFVMEILLDYACRTSATIVSAYKWLENNYGIEISDYKYEYNNQIKISEYLLGEALKGNAIVMAICFQWSKYSLNFIFNQVKIDRGNILNSYKFYLKRSNGIEKYRKLCWKILLLLSTKEEWKNNIILFLEEYSRNLCKKIDRDIAYKDIEYVEELLDILKCNKINFIKVVEKLIKNSKSIGISYDKKWNETFKGREWKLYKLLEFNYIDLKIERKEYKVNKIEKIIDYGNKLVISDIITLTKDINSILSNTLEKKIYYLLIKD